MQSKNSRLIFQQSPCLLMQPCLTEKLGKSPAVFLQQLHYWLTSKEPGGAVAENKRWIYNTAKTWGHQLCMSARQIRRIIQKLEVLGLILVNKLSKKKSDRTNWYTINYEALKNLFPYLPWTEPTSSTKELIPQAVPKITPEAVSLADKVSPSLGQNVLMYIEAEITPEIKTKELDKADSPLAQPQQVEPVTPSGFKSTLAKELLEIWNQEVGNKTTVAEMTKQRARYLVAAYKIKFGASINSWRAYCQAIASSEFLVKTFHQKYTLSLEWALKFDNMQKILEGQFNVNTSFFVKKETIIEKDSLIKELGYLSVPEREGFSKLIDAVGVADYKSWFYNTEPQIKITREGLAFFFSSRFVTDYVNTHFGAMIEKIFGVRVTIDYAELNYRNKANAN